MAFVGAREPVSGKSDVDTATNVVAPSDRRRVRDSADKARKSLEAENNGSDRLVLEIDEVEPRCNSCD